MPEKTAISTNDFLVLPPGVTGYRTSMKPFRFPARNLCLRAQATTSHFRVGSSERDRDHGLVESSSSLLVGVGALGVPTGTCPR